MQNRLKLRKNLNRYDNFNSNFYAKVQNGFLKLSRIKKNRYFIVNSNLEIKKNKELIISKLKKLIK